MKAKSIGNCAIVTAICLAIAAPLLVWHNADIEAAARDEFLRRQQEAIDVLVKANVKQKEENAARKTDALTDGQLKELLRLRAEASALRKETNNWGRLNAADFAQPTSEQRAQLARELSGELLDAARRIAAELPEAERRYREKTTESGPLYMSDLKDYFPSLNGKRMPGLTMFFFIRVGGPKPGDNLLLSESGHETPDGKIARTFAFTDGHAEEVVAPDQENADEYFLEWVRANWGTAGYPPQR